MVCVSTFGPDTNKFKNIILKNWHLLEGLDSPFPKPLFAMRKNQSIGQQIIRADVTTLKPKSDLRSVWNLKPIQGHRKCGTCVACQTTVEGTEFVHNKIKWSHLEFTNCKTQNTVYGIICSCQKLYIGKTTQQINVRITQHRSRIKRKVQNAPMVEHFSSSAHEDTNFKWTVLAVIKPGTNQIDINAALLKKEAYLILKFNTVSTGLNNMSEINSTF